MRRRRSGRQEVTQIAERAAFFVPGPGDRLVPDRSAHSPWGEQVLHGRLLAGVAARAAEAAGGGFTPARITVDLLRAAPMEPLEVSSEIVRDGGRLRLVQVVVTCAGREAARASALLLRPGPQPSGRVWAQPSWSVPRPERLAAMTADAQDQAFLDIRLISEGGLQAVTQKRVWVREVRALVSGEEPSQLVRAVAAADLANPFGNFGEAGLAFINADLSVYLGRVPVGEWIGLEIASRASSAGVSTVAANLYDTQGAVGHCSVASVATRSFGGPPT